MAAISIINVSKSYGDKKASVKALENISFDVRCGELFGIIGPDGAGKTSLFRILATLLIPDEGSAKVGGFDTVKDYAKIRRIIGYMPGRFSLYRDLSVEENLNFFAKVFNTSLNDNYEMIRDIYVRIEPFKKRRAGKLSGGMKQKLALCCALIHRPEILFLDEPTTGVDPVSRKEFWAMLGKLKNEGVTILVSTPYMDEAVLCDKTALIRNGRILSIDAPEKIGRNYRKPVYSISSGDNYGLLNEIRKCPDVDGCYMFGKFLHLAYAGDIDTLVEAVRPDFPDIVVNRIEPSIEDCFIDLMQQR